MSPVLVRLGGPRDDDRVQIRQAIVADAPRIAEVHVCSWKVGYRGLLPQDLLDGLDPRQRVPRWEAILEQSTWPNGATLVAQEADHLVGFAHLRPTRDDDQNPALVGEVASFYVSPELWGKGVGRALMEASCEALTAAGFLAASLWVLGSNARAIGFYEALGWRDDGAVKDDIVGGTPIRDLRYRRTLAA
jgi:GNAT superfamily N-acetyltransferase